MHAVRMMEVRAMYLSRKIINNAIYSEVKVWMMNVREMYEVVWILIETVIVKAWMM